MKNKYWWIKERHNPQLGIYYVAMGNISTKRARECEHRSLYGSNTMLRFDDEASYQKKLDELRANGDRVQ